MQVTWVQSPGQEDALEEGMATHSSSILAWRTPWTEEPGRLQSMGSERGGHDWVTEHARKPDKLKSELNPLKEGQWPSINSQVHIQRPSNSGETMFHWWKDATTQQRKKKLECKSSSLLVFKCPVVLLPGRKLWGRKNNQTSIRDLQTLTQNLQHFLCPPERARS